MFVIARVRDTLLLLLPISRFIYIPRLDQLFVILFSVSCCCCCTRSPLPLVDVVGSAVGILMTGSPLMSSVPSRGTPPIPPVRLKVMDVGSIAKPRHGVRSNNNDCGNNDDNIVVGIRDCCAERKPPKWQASCSSSIAVEMEFSIPGPYGGEAYNIIIQKNNWNERSCKIIAFRSFLNHRRGAPNGLELLVDPKPPPPAPLPPEKGLGFDFTKPPPTPNGVLLLPKLDVPAILLLGSS